MNLSAALDQFEDKYGKHTEKTYRDAFCTVIDWFHANFSLLMQVSKPTDRLANAIDPSHISKSGEQTPCTAMKRNLRIVIWQMPDGKTKVFFSTDTEMSGEDVIAYYRTRFQIEFCFRDAKEFTGLCDCQARSKDKLDFAFNASLFAVNAAKVFRYKSDRSISMSTFKSLMVNQYLCKRIFSMSGFRPNMKIATNRMQKDWLFC